MRWLRRIMGKKPKALKAVADVFVSRNTRTTWYRASAALPHGAMLQGRLCKDKKKAIRKLEAVARKLGIELRWRDGN